MAVAYSGGRDSTALLHAVLAVTADTGMAVLALHVHHGLSPNADEWLAHAERQCLRWAREGAALRFIATRLVQTPPRGESIEAWARTHRYRALREMALAHGADRVLLGHHRRDQAETLLLQALRGAGVAGLAGMPRAVERDGIVWLRPWLNRSRHEIDAYLREHRLDHVDDDSNDDPRFARNRLRAQAWPGLLRAFPDAEASLATAAGWAQQANEALAELTALDLAAVARGPTLDVDAWLRLSAARRSLTLRGWLRACGGTTPSAALVTRLGAQLPLARGGARWQLPSGERQSCELHLHRGTLQFAGSPPPEGRPLPRRPTVLAIRRAGTYAVPAWAGRLEVQRVGSDGVPLAWLAQLELRVRQGGERFQAGPGRPPRSLKKQFQAAALPAWARDGPLLYSGGQLVYVPGLGLDARLRGGTEPGLVQLRWLPDSTDDDAR